MRKKKESGFSLIELLLVVVIIGIIAAISVPAYQRGMWAAENGSAFSNLRTIASTEVAFYTQNGRFGRLDEVNNILHGGAGTSVGAKLVRGRYVFEMSPAVPTDTELKTEYFISATRDVAGDAVYRYELNQSGKITQVLPLGSVEP